MHRNDSFMNAHWQEVFIIFGIQRCRFILPYCDFPREVIKQPSGLEQAAITYWKIYNAEDRYSDSSNDIENDLIAPHNSSNKPEDVAFATIAEAYNEIIMNDVQNWALDHLADPSRTGSLFLLGRRLVRVRDSDKFLQDQSCFITQDKKESVHRVINLYLGYDAEQTAEELINAASEVPVSMYERSILSALEAYGHDYLDTLLHTVLRNHRIILAWKEISNILTSEQREQLLKWIELNWDTMQI